MSAPPLDLSPSQRKATGAYYTPPALVRLLLAHALQSGMNDVLDPACGAGDFLIAVRDRLPCARLVGVDIDPTAVARARATLPGAHIYHADALLHPPAALQPASFDLVIGNPPFVNAIEGDFDHLKKQLRARYPDVRGAADLAHYFLRQAIDLVRPGGRVALVLPRAILNSPAAQTIRANLPAHLRPNMIYAPERCDFFPGAAVFVCLLVLGPEPRCRVSTDPDPVTAQFHDVPTPTGENWWAAVHGFAAVDAPRPGAPLSTQFQVVGSMTAGDAYDLLPHLVDSEAGPGLKFTTTGLIDPRRCLWGTRRCRYLRHDFNYPRIPDSTETALTPSLARPLARARRPKILVAGLARRVEAFLDAAGEHLGAVSTFSIFHPQDDVEALRELLDQLLSPRVSVDLMRSLGANAMRGRHITMKKSYLHALPIAAAR
jgi:SAM-dependent methyltransferase